MWLASRSPFLLLLLAPIFSLSQSNNTIEGGKSIENVTCELNDHRGSKWIGTSIGLTLQDSRGITHYKNDPANKNSLIDDRVLSLAEDEEHNIWIGTKKGISRLNPVTGEFLNFSSDQKGSQNFTGEQCHVFVDSNTNIWVSHSEGLSYYNRSKPGFQAFSLTPDGALPDYTLELGLSEPTPYYKTWWVILLFLIALVAGMYAIYSYRVRRQLSLEKLRSRIATDLHDEIGARLSNMTSFSDSVREQAREKLPEVEPLLEKMGSTGRTMASNIIDTVWAIDPKNDNVEMMIHRMHAEAHELCALKKVNLHAFTEKLLYPTRMSLEERRNVYLIFKEALINSLNYSGCNNIGLELGMKGGHFVMEIIDDGKGFEYSKQSEGVGLKTMRSRAREIHGDLVIHSSEKGTTIHLSFPAI